ncbi:MAG TPA: SRPBCC family protein [Planctomycetota bacterium]|nr:SRPBCC family protein [Planctomycetota bacterium]
MAFYQLRRSQVVPATPDRVWDVLSSPLNLREITPPALGFEVLTPDLPDRIRPGLIVVYRVRPLLRIPVTWVAEITHVVPGESFVDEQRAGPYALWHHEHRMTAVDGGVRIDDLVSYIPPLGLLGRIAHALFLRRALERIFDYRREALDRLFAGPEAKA